MPDEVFFTSGSFAGAGTMGGIPPNALLLEDGTPLLMEDGTYILTEP